MLRLFARRPEMRRERERARLAALSIKERQAEAEANYWKNVTEQLDGTQDHLVVVTNFDGFDSVAQRIAGAIKEMKVGLDQPVRFSVHTTKEMEKERGFELYSESADSLAEALGGMGVDVRGYNSRPESIAGHWRTAEALHEAAFWYHGGRQGKLSGLHVAVLSAMSMPELNVSYEDSLNGGAYIYRGTDENGKPNWDKIGRTSLGDRLKDAT